jgi:hypothetical protein
MPDNLFIEMANETPVAHPNKLLCSFSFACPKENEPKENDTRENSKRPVPTLRRTIL